MFKFMKPKQDIRFLDPESLRRNQDFGSCSENGNQAIHSKELHLKVNFVTDDQEQDFKDSKDSWIKVQDAEPETSSSSFLKLVLSDQIQPYTESNGISELEAESITLFAKEEAEELNSLGVFSDSKIYSALIQNVLKPYAVNFGHFNHPNTFVKNKFKVFDDISAWIIFLSDEDDSDFLDQFLNRYESKPTLFLFPKMERTKCQSKINDFVLEHGIVAKDMVSKDKVSKDIVRAE